MERAARLGVLLVLTGCPDGNAVDSTGSGSGSETTTGEASSSSSGRPDVGPGNVPPRAEDDVYRVQQGIMLVAGEAEGVLANDEDDDGDPLTVSVASPPVSGAVLALGEDGGFTYTPVPGWWGEDAFTYWVTDERGATDSSNVRIVVSPTTISLADVAAGIGGFAIDGEAQSGLSGASVSGTGDVDGDGFGDVIVGAPELAPRDGLAFAGRSYVVFGQTDGSPVALADVASGTGGFVVDGQASSDRSGISVSHAGDLNGDGAPDVIVGAFEADPPGSPRAGRSYVVFGKSNGTPVLLANVANGMGGFVIDGESPGDASGCSVSGAGDVNGDGLDDLVVGADRADPNALILAGRSYVVFGGEHETVSLADVAAGVGGFAIDGQVAEGHSGVSVSGAGDVNGDGLADLIVGAHRVNPSGFQDAGRSYVVFGKREDTALVSLADVAAGVGGFAIDGASDGDSSGVSVSGAGDVNGDGRADVVVGARGALIHRGRSYVVFGKIDGAQVSLEEVENGVGGFAIIGQAAFDESGRSVSGAGDVNGDGLDDVIIGTSVGRGYVVFGKADGTLILLGDIARGMGGFAIDGGAGGDASSISVSGAGNVNGDGFADVIVGAAHTDLNGTENAGRSHVIFGGDWRWP